MGDSQNWSSFDDEPVAPARRARAKANAQSVGQTPPPEQPQAKGAFDKLQGLDLRNFRNRLMFGGLVGFCTGATFGAIDSVKLYARQHGKVSLAGLSTFARGAGVSGGSFAGFFLTYQGVKTLMEVQRGEEDLVNVGVATAVAALPFVGSTVMRQNVPYALMLIALDHFHEELSAHRK
uniref:Mitochondrial import inner membrane translocase subunit TIM22 n=1 Tax=Globisporangium ultimum (strain ATCC 200006 / CBS 805.95 / DAOM BR144) TaxID=431595 RepID=K3X9K3_GLOUD